MSEIFIISLLLQLSVSGILSECAYMLSVGESVNAFYLIAFIIYAAVILIINKGFLKKERGITGIFVLNLVLFALASFGEIVLRGNFSFGAIIITIIILGWLTVQSVVLTIKEPTVRMPILALEGNVIVVIIFSIMVSTSSAEPLWIIPGAFGLVCAVAALILKRIGKKPEARDVIMISLTAVIILLIAVFFAVFAAAPAGEGLSDFAKIIAACAVAVWKAFEKFVAWISSLFRDPNYSGDALEGIGVASGKTASEDYTETDGASGTIIMIIIGVIIVALLVLLFVKIHKHKIKTVGINVKGISGLNEKEHRSLKDAFKIFLEKQRVKKLKKKFLKENASKPLGIYYSIELKLSKSKDKKIPGESPREFLKRIAELNLEDIKIENVDKLADEVDASLFG